MKINCNATSTGSSLVLPPSPGSALGFPSPVASLILSPLQVAINKQAKLDVPFITSVHTPKVKNSNPNPANPYSNHSPNYYNYRHTHNDNITITCEQSQTHFKTDYKANHDSSDSDDSEDMSDHENNYNFNNTSTKRKWESPDLSTFSKCKKPTDYNDHIPTSNDLTCNNNSFASSFVYLSTPKDLPNSPTNNKQLESDCAKLGDNNVTTLLTDESINLIGGYDCGLSLESEADKINSILADESCKSVSNEGTNTELTQEPVVESHHTKVSRLSADGADFRIEEDEDNNSEGDVRRTAEGDQGSAPDQDSYAHSSRGMSAEPSSVSPDLESPSASHDPCELLCTASIAAEWDKEASSSPSSPEEKEEEFNPYTFIKNLPARPSDGPPVLLPPLLARDPLYTLVLDLDETLVHCSTESLAQPDLVFPVTFNSVEYTVFARKRPHIQEFLSRVSSLFEVVVFTASQEVYADKLLNILDPDRKFIKHRLFRDSCLCVEGNYLKDLTVLGRDLSKVVIVDNSPQAFGYQIDNGIPIESWFDDDNDTELLSVYTFLESLLSVDDVRPFIREKYKLHEIIARA